MSASILMIVAIASLSIGYVVYGRFITLKYGLDPNRKTPAHTKRDEVDYVPTKAMSSLKKITHEPKIETTE